MAYQVTHIRLGNLDGNSTEEITHVKLSRGTEETVAIVVAKINIGSEYYYTKVDGSKAEIESVDPPNNAPYIRTKANRTTKDNLLSLPRF